MEIIDSDERTLRYILPNSGSKQQPLVAHSRSFTARFFNTTVREINRLHAEGRFRFITIGKKRYVTHESLTNYALTEFFRRRGIA